MQSTQPVKKNSVFRKKSVEHILADVEQREALHGGNLVKSLTLRDLTAMGIAAVIGAGIFSTIGTASANGGPAVSLLFIFTAVACVFSALCYAEFASTIPISGSAYTYAYTSFGEIIAWIIGWDLLMEYAIGNIAVAISWSDYFTSLLSGLGLEVPPYLTMDYLSAFRANEAVTEMLASGKTLQDASSFQQLAYQAWNTAPLLGSQRLIADLPALGITVFITWLVFVGIQESKQASNLMVLLKIIVILVVISVGAFYVNPGNWDPFAPNGIPGVLKGVSAVFFSYIGFDAISTTAEECKNPQRDLPRAMIYALIICTILYVLITLVLTGMVNYTELAVGDPLAYVFEKVNLNFLAGVISASAVIATTSVLLVFQLGQPRIWMSMSRDGLLPKPFAAIHPRYKTPYISTIITGIVVAVPALFMNLTEVTDLTSIGTLFAFVLVSGGVLLLDTTGARRGRFQVPYYNGKYVLPLLLTGVLALLLYYNPASFEHFLTLEATDDTAAAVGQKLLHMGYVLVCLVMTYLTFTRNLSLIPVLGVLVNLYLMVEVGPTNWKYFLIWLFIGLVVYFSYGYRKSKLGTVGNAKF